jgi:integrase
MPTVKLTKKLIALHPTPEKSIELYDSERRGLICKITPNGSRVFLVNCRSADGTKRKPRIGVFGQITLDQAREAAGKLLAKVSLGEDPSRDRRSSRAGLTVTALCDRFLTAYAEQHSKPSYLKQQKRMIETRIKPELGTTKVSAIIRHDVMDLHHKLRVTPYEANRVLALLSVIFKQAELWGMRPEGSNPCRLVKKYKEKRRERLLSDAEVSVIFQALDNAQRDKTEPLGALLAIRLLFATACRASEITGLRWDFVDKARAEIVWPDGKTGSFKKPLTGEIQALFEASPKSEGIPYICVGSHADGCLSNSVLAKTWERILGQAGVHHCGLHAIRHRVSTDIANSGASIQDGMRLTGHKAVQTYARYLHAEDDRVREAAESVSTRRQSIIRSSH